MRNAVTFLFVVLSASAGCMSVPSWWEKPKAAPSAEVAAKPARPRPAVSAEQITESNAREMAGALLDELDRDAQTESLAVVEETAGSSKTADGKKR
jgi:hypothetical protein